MPTARLTRNQGFEIFKLIASIFVVFIHVQFPNALGVNIATIARMGVPGFFAISGFFSYRTNSKKLVKRMNHILLLTGIGIAVELFVGCISVEFFGVYAEDFRGSSVAYLRAMVPTLEELGRWLVISLNPIREPLWYLTAVLTCYAILWLYVSFYGERAVDYTNFYLLCTFFLVTYLSEGVMADAAREAPRGLMIRSGLLLGMPMFGIGLFLGQYWETVWSRFHLTPLKLRLLLIGGIALSLIERWGIGGSNAHIGSILGVIAVILLCAKHPTITKSPVAAACCNAFGPISTGVYLLHPVVLDLYELFLQESVRKVCQEHYWAPLIVATLSLLTAALWHILWTALKKLFKK